MKDHSHKGGCMNSTLLYGLDEVENREEREKHHQQWPTSVWFPSFISELMQVLYII